MQLTALHTLFLSFSMSPVLAAEACATQLAIVVTQEPSPTEAPLSIWTGRLIDKSGTKREEALTQTYARDLRQKLAAVRVMVDVDRKLEEAAAQSLELWIRATRAGYPERKDVLVEALLLRSRILQALNRGPAAAAELIRVFPTLPPDSTFESAPLSPEERTLATAVASDPRIAKARETLANPREATSAQGSAERIDSIVQDALERGDVSLSMSLGERAVAALVSRIEANLEEFPPVLRDPLVHLTAINSARAAELVATAYAKGGPLWKARVLRLLNAGVFAEGASGLGTQLANSWKSGRTEREPPTFAVPRWFDVLEFLLIDPATKRETVQLLHGIAERNALTPGIRRALTAILMDPSTSLVGDVLAALNNTGSRPTVRELYEGVLESPWPNVRTWAANSLANWERNDALIAASRHTDSEVRRAVATSMRRHWQTTPKYPSGTESRQVEPKPTANDRIVLAALAADADAAVRVQAAMTIAQLSTPLDTSVYEKLARDSDSRVRAAVLQAGSLPLEQRANLALGLATDSDESVLQSLDQSLKNLGEVPMSEGVPDAWIPVLRARRANEVLPFERDNTPVASVYERLKNSTPGMRLLAEWIASDDSVGPQRAFINRLSELTDPQKWTLIEIDDGTWAQVYRRLAASRENRSHWLVRYVLTLDHVPAPALSSVAEDATLDVVTRLGALAVAAKEKSDRIGALFVSILSSKTASSTAGKGLDLEYTKLIASELDDSQSKLVTETLLSSTDVNTNLAFEALNTISAQRALTTSESDKVLNRWIDDAHWNASPVVTAALKEVAQRPRAQQGNWLSRAAHIGNTCLWAFRVIGDTRDDSYVELLRQAIVGPFDVSGLAKPNFKSAALNALTRYFDARAADIILEAAGSTPDAGFRDECFKALETIRKYEAEKGRVAKDRAIQIASATAVRDLVEMLDDPSATIRVQALRALATLGAVEQMPVIVRRLKDADEQVRKAAEAALDTLNTPPTNK